MKALLPLLLLVVVFAGCTTKAKARAEARAAFVAGQQQAFAQMQEARRTNIRVIGNVQNHEIEWAENLTLSQAIAMANYTPRFNPTEITVIRQREQIRVNPKDLLQGKDVPLEPGDTVEIR